MDWLTSSTKQGSNTLMIKGTNEWPSMRQEILPTIVRSGSLLWMTYGYQWQAYCLRGQPAPHVPPKDQRRSWRDPHAKKPVWGLLVCFKITEGHSFDVLEDKIQLPIRSENSVEISFGLSFIVLMKYMWYFPCILHQFWQKREKRVFFMEE